MTASRRFLVVTSVMNFWENAIRENNVEMIKSLIDSEKEEKTISIEISTENVHFSPLSLSAYLGNLEICKILLSYHVSIKNWAKINQPNDQGWTALMFSVKQNHLEIVLELLDHGADISVTNVKGQTALNMVTSNDMKELLEYKLSHSFGDSI